MKSRKVKAAARSNAFRKKLKSTIPIDDGENSYEGEDSVEEDDNSLQEDSSSEEEVLPITDDENDSSEEEAEGETENSEDEDLPDLNNWGKKKGIYYNADFVDKDRGKTYREEDLELENAEREAADLQLQTAVQLDQFESSAYLEDYDRAHGLISKKFPSKSGEGELQDVASLEIEKLKHESKKYPKLSEYKENFKEKFDEVNEKLAPLLELSEKFNLDEDLVYYIKMKYQILLHYLMNVNFYFYLKCSENVPENHPIYTRIEQFKNLDEQLNSHKNYLKEIGNILQMLKENKDLSLLEKKSDPSLRKSKDKNSSERRSGNKNKRSISESCDVDMEETSQNSLSGTEEMKQDFDEEGNTGEMGDEKRTITYQIAKNKGLTVKRKKELRNPRVHNRMKYRKAKIRRKGQVRGVIKEMKRYGGEPTGISSHVVRSIKIK